MTCCGVCGMPELSDMFGINRAYVETYRKEKCPPPIACPLCIAAPNPNLGARCEADRCAPFDVRRVPEYSACMSDADCMLRPGVGCCACGVGTSDWIAVSHSGARALSSAVCDPVAPCPPCGPPPPPPELRAVCANNVCQRVGLR